MPDTTKPQVVQFDPSGPIQNFASQIQTESAPVLIVLGDCAPALDAQIQSLFTRSVLPTVADAKAIIIDAGAGSAAKLGRSAGEQDSSPTLVSVTTASESEFDPNHDFIVQVKAPNADTIPLVFQLAEQLAKANIAQRKPILLLTIAGEANEKKAVLRAARKGWPIVAIKGTGGISDQVLQAFVPPETPDAPPPPLDPDTREIVETARVYPFDVNGNTDDLRRILASHLQHSAEALDSAWTWYDDLDHAAMANQHTFRQIQNSLLVLGVLATLLAILSNVHLPDSVRARVTTFVAAYGPLYRNALKYLIILVPIGISVLTAVTSRFREGNKWILLRAAAESVKREIFRYRAQAGPYSDEQCTQTSRDSKLAALVKTITESLMQSEVNKTSIRRENKKPADRENYADRQERAERCSFLSADDYIEKRVQDQLKYFKDKTATLNRQLLYRQVAILVAGAIGTFLAAVEFAVWVALTTALATALTTKLEMDQTENSLVQYNVALTSLRNIETWWRSLSAWERGRPRNVDLLIDQTEKVLEGEMAGWVQQMRSTLDKLTEKEEKARPEAKAASA